MSQENQKINIALDHLNKPNTIDDPIIKDRNVLNDEDDITEDKITLPYIAKFIVLLVLGMVGSSLVGMGVGYILHNPLFFFNFKLGNFIALIIGFIILLISIELIGIFFSRRYFLMVIAAIVFSLIMGVTTFVYSNIFILISFTIATFLVFIVFFIGIESDTNNQFSFKFFQAIRSSSSFSTWFTFSLAACFALSLISLLGEATFTVPDSIVTTAFGFVADRTGVDYTTLNSSLSDLQKKGIDISLFKGFTKNVEDLAQTPKDFVAKKLNSFVHSNSILISLFIALDMFLTLRFLCGIISMLTKILTFLVFYILKLTGFYSIQTVTKEASIIKV